ncbi:lipid-A-disaccharide kinase [Candidatus Kryptobacter tengchongensis]|uniref:tetraacyldisaccharide 4'-kinase n=1 Tax=Kryptobacter tengchongensis TaxID=1643429 RepID=UPI000725CFAD|nr:tetraacyldisaccharide 4'-kinase [Candidatus Kryptobacter tengchongensis]CUU10919.1 lipid-A-disaccharide kinase [Candidatus Kryptobacter tengchongensis]
MMISLFKIWRGLRFLLIPFSFIYWVIVVLRNLFYDRGILKVKKLPRPVISVGNILAGGTGKTPMVEWIGKYFSTLGKKVAILSRGYGRRTRGFVLVTDGEKIFANADECGDEPFQMALKSVEEKLGWIVAVCEDRYIAGIKLLENFDVDVFLLDDGFQRRDLHRDFDIVIISGEETNEFLIPAGLKREPLSSLKRANVLCFRDEIDVKNFNRYLGEDKLRVKFRYELLEIRKFFDYILDKSEFSSKKAVAFSGIGKHINFVKLLKDNNFCVVKDFEFPDHYRYTWMDIEDIVNFLNSTGAEFAITTEKDYARLFEMRELKNFPFFYTRIEVKFLEGENDLKQKLLELV